MKKLIKPALIFITVSLLALIIILKLNIYNLAYQTIFFTNKDISISDIKVNNEPVYKQNNDNNKKRIYPVTINTKYLTKIQIGKQKRYIKVSSLKKDKYININIISYKNKKLKRTNYHLHLLHQNFAELTIENKGINKGYIFTNYTNAKDFPAHVFIMDMKGNIIFSRVNKIQNCSAFHLQKWKTKNNEVLYSLHEQSRELPTKRYIGNILILDKKFNKIDEVKILPTSKHPELEADEHDFILLDKNHYILETFWIKTYTKLNTFSYLDSVIQEIKDGKVIFDWLATEQKDYIADHIISKDITSNDAALKQNIPLLANDRNETIIDRDLKIYINDNSICHNPLGVCDEFYLNSLSIDPVDNNLIASFKNEREIIKIDRNTGEVLWQLGGPFNGFNLTKKERFTYQHHAHFEQNDTLFIFDNNVNYPSRILKYQFDKEHKNVVKKEFIDLDDYVQYFGSVQAIDNDKMVISYGNGVKYAIKIIDSKENVYWSAKFDDKIIKLKKDNMGNPYGGLYRAYYYEKID